MEWLFMSICSACNEEVGLNWTLGQLLLKKKNKKFFLCNSCYDEIIEPIKTFERIKMEWLFYE